MEFKHNNKSINHIRQLCDSCIYAAVQIPLTQMMTT